MDREGASPSSSTRTEPVRSRWSPKPDQILILESIFNSGIVNPPKDETVRIRKMLEKFGAVADANVFYWFQNRRSRSRRRQRQLQAAAAITKGAEEHHNMTTMMTLHHHQHGGASQIIDMGFGNCNNSSSSSSSSSSANHFLNDSSSHQMSSLFLDISSGGYDYDHSNNNGMENNLYTMYCHESEQHSSNVASILNQSNQNSNLHDQQGMMITVFINGVATEVTKGAIDIKAMFGQDLVLVNSSGLPLPTDEFGFLIHSLQHGQAYFLVPRQA